MAPAELQQQAVTFTHDPSVSSFAVSPQTYLVKTSDPRYSYIATGSLVFDSSLRILLLQRAENDSMPGRWEIPGGAVDDDDESILHGVARELWEETGLEAVQIGPQVGDGEFFTSRSGKKIGKFVFVVGVEQGEQDVRLDPKEHQHYVWASKEEVEAKMAGTTKLEFTTAELKRTVLQAFSLTQVTSHG